MMYVLGIITGLILSLIVQGATTRYQTPIERTLKQLASKTKQKGAIIEPEASDVEDWIDNLNTK